MQSSTIPGFREIFPGEETDYADLVWELDSDTIIKMCAALNAELTCPEPRQDIHKRINSIAIHRFTAAQRNTILRAFGQYKEKAGDGFQGMIFFRRYIVAMMLKELNNYRVVDDRDDQLHHDFQFFKAYLKIIDEVNDGDHGDIDFKTLDKTDPFWLLKMCWLPVLRQFEYSEKGNIILEMLKAACFLEFAANSFREPLREYLGSFGLSSPGELMGSLNAIYQATEMYDPNVMLRKFTLITVSEKMNIKHLKAQTISPENRGKINFSDLKKRPVFFSPQRQAYVVLDNYLAKRKIFRGPYFELFHQTSLKPKEKDLQNDAFVRYSQQVADVLEKRCLKPILTLLAGQAYDIMHFDDGSDSVPDGYLRIGRKIFLFEYKVYFFPEKLAQNPNFDELKAYFDRGFIANEKGKEKGIHQLRKQIGIIYDGGFAFDPEVKTLLETGRLTIYPIITYNDFYFGLHGLNFYLYEAFIESIPKEYGNKLTIVPLVLMSLDSLMDMVLTGQGLLELEQHIRHFLGIASQAQRALKFTRTKADFLLAYAGFDELYPQFAPQPGALEKTHEMLQRLLELAGISFEELERALE